MAVSAGVDVIRDSLDSPLLRIQLPDRTPVDFPLNKLPDLLKKIRGRHQLFLDGQLPIADVVESAEHLLAATAAMTDPKSGSQLHFRSRLPLGSGLGSSAACILALLKVLQPQWENSRLFEHAIQAESFQHGTSSGLDVATSLHGGLLSFCDSRFENLSPVPALPSFQILDSGRPADSTGECVSAVSKRFPSSDPVWSEFRDVTQTLLACLQAADTDGFHNCIRQNHQLLCRIGVVPPAVEDHISTLEQSGYAAKICGAGSLRGEAAGMVLVFGDSSPAVPGSWREMNLSISCQGTTLLEEGE
jgi:hydroxymethylglutaryl-CoA synthase